VVRRSARFKHHHSRRTLRKEAQELRTREPPMPADPAGLLGDRNLENSRCDINCHDVMLFHGLLLCSSPKRLWHTMPIES
jgi:hypothetical protein